MTRIKIIDILNPSNDASTTSPGRNLKNFFPAFEFATELVKKPETFTTPVRTPLATLSVILVTFLALYEIQAKENQYQLYTYIYMLLQESTDDCSYLKITKHNIFFVQ